RGAPPDALDLSLELPLTIAEATLGCRVQVPTLDGPVDLNVPPGAASGKYLRLRERGLENAAGRRGDLYARVRVVPPDGSGLAPGEAETLRRIAERTPALRTGPGWPTSRGAAAGRRALDTADREGEMGEGGSPGGCSGVEAEWC